MIQKTNGFLEEYYRQITDGEIIAGQELKTELSKLIADLDDERYIYDTTDADERMDFMENCIRLTKAPFYGQPMKLMLWQKAFISTIYGFKMNDGEFAFQTTGSLYRNYIDRFRRILLLIARKNTKALALDTRIPTPQGDKTIADIQVGDYVFDEFGKPVKVTGTSEIFKDRPCYKVVFEDGEEITADENHKWTVQTKGSRKIKNYIPISSRRRTRHEQIDEQGRFVITTAEMVKDFFCVRKDGKGIEYKYRVPMGQPVEYPEKALFSPYVLGLWVGDGDRHDNRLAVAKADIEELKQQLDIENMTINSVKMFSGKYEVRIGATHGHSNEVRDVLRELGVWKNKHIPEVYFYGSVRQRQDLLCGLMDTDGTVSKAGECAFVQKSERIVLDVSRLLSSLCIKHSIRKEKAKCNGKDCGIVYRITFYVDKTFSCFRYKRKYERLKDHLSDRMKYKSIVGIIPMPIRDTKCITVASETGLFLCGQRNTVTHNSETCSGMGLTELIVGKDGEDIVCSSNDDTQANIIYQAIDTMRLMIDPKQQDTWKNQQWIKNKINGSKVFKLTDRTRNKEGRNIDFGIVDEVHEMKDNVIIKSIEQSQSLKPNPKLIMITTEGFVNDGFLDGELVKARKILNGEDDSVSAERYLPWLYTQDNEQEVWQDPNSWYKSNPTLGIVKRWDYLQEQVDLARRSKPDRMFTLSKDFNFKVTNSEAWLMPEILDYNNRYSIDDLRGTIALGAIDLAETTDMCSAKVLLLNPKDNTKYIHSMYWIPQSKLEKASDREAGAKYEEWARDGLIRIVEGNEVDVATVADWYYELYKDYGIRLYKCGYDQRFAKDFLRRMDDYGFEYEMIYQNRYVLSSPMKLLEADLRDQTIWFNENEIDRWCLLNTSVQVWDTGHIMPVKIKKQASRRIDGTLTFIMCEEMYRRYKTEILR